MVLYEPIGIEGLVANPGIIDTNQIRLRLGKGDCIMKRRVLLRPSVDITHTGVIGGNGAIRRPVEIGQKIREVCAAKLDVRSGSLRLSAEYSLPSTRPLAIISWAVTGISCINP